MSDIRNSENKALKNNCITVKIVNSVNLQFFYKGITNNHFFPLWEVNENEHKLKSGGCKVYVYAIFYLTTKLICVCK